MRNAVKYWLPRLLVIGFALAIPFSTPGFISEMTREQFIVWAFRLTWVLFFPLILFGALGFAILKRRLKQKNTKALDSRHDKNL